MKSPKSRPREGELSGYAEERENARVAAEIAPSLKDFIAPSLTADMLSVSMFDRVLKVVSVDDIQVLSVQTSLPDPSKPDRTVHIAIEVKANCTAIVERDYSFVSLLLGTQGLPSAPVVQAEKVGWIGGINPTAEVEQRRFKNIVPQALLSKDELGLERCFKQN